MDAWTTNTVQTADRVSAFLWKVYGWMAVGLGLTALVAFAVAGSPALLGVLVGNRLVFFALVIAELGLVFPVRARRPAGAGHGGRALRALFGAERRHPVGDPARLHGRIGDDDLRGHRRHVRRARALRLDDEA